MNRIEFQRYKDSLSPEQKALVERMEKLDMNLSPAYSDGEIYFSHSRHMIGQSFLSWGAVEDYLRKREVRL